MRKTIAMVLPVLAAVGLLLAFSTARADDTTPTKGKGTITGMVMKDGQALANAKVRLAAPPRRGGQPDKLIEAPEGGKGKKGRPGGAPGGPGAGRLPPAIAETTTDADGKFTLTDIAAGDYVVVAGMRGQGMGRERVTVTDGQTVNVTINVKKPKPRRAGPATNPSVR